MSLIIWILVNFGISNGIAHSSLSEMIWERILLMQENPRGAPPKFFTCVMCLGFWTALLLSLTWMSPTGFWLWDCFLGSATSWIIYLFIMDKQNKT